MSRSGEASATWCMRSRASDEEPATRVIGYNGWRCAPTLNRSVFLTLDEATSHLDVTRERQVNDAIRQLKLTRIIIAHRPETIASADRVMILGQGSSQAIQSSATHHVPVSEPATA